MIRKLRATFAVAIITILIFITTTIDEKQALLNSSSQVSVELKNSETGSDDEELLLPKSNTNSKLSNETISESGREHVHGPTDIEIGTNEELTITSPPLIAADQDEEEQGQDLSTSIITQNELEASGHNTSIGVEDTSDSRMSCVIHVGPHKTGSSSLQSFLLLNNGAKTALERDNYEVPFFTQGEMYKSNQKAKNHGSLAYCLRSLGGNNLDPRCSTMATHNGNLNYFQSFVNNAARSGSNILLTSEPFDFDDLNIAGLVNPLVPHYKVHVVVYYRRFYEWIHSLYNQWTKSGLIDKTFVEWLTYDIIELWQHRYSAVVYERYKNHDGVYNVSVVNMHEDPTNFNTNVRFACDHLDHAPHTCQVARSTKISRSNPSVNVSWLLFRKYMNDKINRPVAESRWNQLKGQFNKMNYVPKVCLSPEISDDLWRVSLKTETTLTPEHWYNSKQGLEALKSDFEEKIKTKLCSIDIKVIWSSDEWQSILAEFQ